MTVQHPLLKSEPQIWRIYHSIGTPPSVSPFLLNSTYNFLFLLWNLAYTVVPWQKNALLKKIDCEGSFLLPLSPVTYRFALEISLKIAEIPNLDPKPLSSLSLQKSILPLNSAPNFLKNCIQLKTKPLRCFLFALRGCRTFHSFYQSQQEDPDFKTPQCLSGGWLRSPT